MRSALLAAALLLAAPAVSIAEDAPDLSSQKARFSYAVGFQIGHSLKADDLELDPAVLNRAINDVLSGAEPAISQKDMEAALQAFEVARAQDRMKQAMESKKKGEAFLAEHGKEKGVVTTDSGLQYKVVEAGSGKSPSATDQVTVNYRGTLLDGTEFDSSYARGEPATFPVGNVIQGWQEVLPLMKEGAKWEVAIPSELAYGERGTGHGIGPNETLLFTIELIKVN
jgi:FKBP-type peptidyl-prolyl cis-trans isomerase FklB